MTNRSIVTSTENSWTSFSLHHGASFLTASRHGTIWELSATPTTSLAKTQLAFTVGSTGEPAATRIRRPLAHAISDMQTAGRRKVRLSTSRSDPSGGKVARLHRATNVQSANAKSQHHCQAWNIAWSICLATTY